MPRAARATELQIETLPPGAVVPAFEVLDAAIGEGAPLFRLRLGAVEQHFRKHNPEKAFPVNLIAGAGDHAQRGDHVADDRILGQCPLVRQAARDSRGKKTAFRRVPDLVLAVQQGELSPRQLMLIPIAANVLDDPPEFRVFRWESQRGHLKG